MMKRYKFHRNWFTILLLLQLFADLALGYYTYFKVNSFGSYVSDSISFS